MIDREEPPVNNLLMLSDDLVLNCLAHVSRLYYPTLSLVCKRFRSLLASVDLFQIRTLLGLTESFVYVCLRLHTDPSQLGWFILCQRPNTSRKVLVPISIPSPTCASLSGVAVVGPNIYVIGGGSKNNAWSSVMVMDSRFYTWREAPSMRVARVLPSACVVDEKIYVAGGYDNLDSTNWMEVFDTKTQTWEFLHIPSEEICLGSEYQSAKYEGTVYVRSRKKRATYKLHKGRWRAADIGMDGGWALSRYSYCVIENVFYRYSDRKMHWYDVRKKVWTTVKGLERFSMLLFSKGNVQLADHGGKIAILCEEYVFADKSITIWCAEIILEKRQNQEIWGTLECFENVLISNDNPYISNKADGTVGLVHALTSTVW
ncbi:F-box/kelch-repeat protein [Raphanus sativus]|uniref:F-box/kelch-repeat protein At4g23580 n=1 Tax=Raphanus sativus TaxID=3726 RepID=A0A6J0NC09_RAPSA|nr:F-box/kelch-repeat protein At4g23580 [Raphanus sativus]KAJ4899002.1 F-box/kelch-repeat protein [Raphanus sativus]